MSESHQTEELMTDRAEITDEEALFLSELPVEEFDVQLEQLRERRRCDKLSSSLKTMDAPTTFLDVANKLSELDEEQDYLDHVIASLGQEGIRALEQFEEEGHGADIETAIKKLGQSVDLTSDDNPDKPGRLSNLGSSHAMRFKHLGEMPDIDKAIEFLRQAVNLTPNGHPNKPTCLNNLGNSHQTRFERLREMPDLDKAIELYHQAIDLIPNGHPNTATYLGNLGNSRQTRFECLGEVPDIDNAIELNRQAVDLSPDGHPDTATYLNNLGLSHQTRFERIGEMADIDKAIESQCQAVDLTPHGHPNKPSHLSNLGSSHQARFERLHEMSDIDKAIDFQFQAVDLTPHGHPNKPGHLNNLGNSHQARFEHLSELANIDKAIEFQFQAVDLTPDGHPDKPIYLNNLGLSHQRRFERLDKMVDIDRAIESQSQAVDLTPHGHPNKPKYLNNLGNSHLTRFERLREMADIDKAIEFQWQAIDFIPNGHPDKAMYLRNLGISHQARFEHLGEMADIDKAITNFEQCAMSIAGPPIVRFKAARSWISGLQLRKKDLIFDAPSLHPQHILIDLIPEVVWLGAPIHQRFHMIQDVVGSSIHEAVSAAIRAQQLELAVEWMEQGRSIVWSQLRRLRSPFDDLQDAHPALAQKFQDVQRRIEIAFLPCDLDNKKELAADSPEQQARAHRRNIQKREDLLTEIRSKQGFESFLRPEKFSVLSKACQGHLVVLLTVAEELCDALVILPSSSIIHLSFTEMSQGVVSELHALWENSRKARLSNRGYKIPAACHVDDNPPIQKDNLLATHLSNRGEGAATLDLGPMSSLLADLWEKVVHPIVVRTENDLFDLTDDRLPHITWCPSGPLSFLPFHAAGIYSSDSKICIGISDYAVSSYTPSLMALLSNSSAVRLGRPSILMVTQPSTPKQRPLPGTTVEAEKIMEQAALHDLQSSILHLPQTQATVFAVNEQLETHGWIHLACHGIQQPDPMESSFALDDGSLTLQSLMQKSMQHAQFAFLSACQTATGDEKMPDESMHLTSGMLAAGFRSVVGTMWSIEDSVAPEVAETFYGRLFEEGRKSDWKAKPKPAYALHFALQRLREESIGDRELMKWVPFVHYGI